MTIFMKANQEANYLAALDLGSSKTRALMAEVVDAGESASQLRFLGLGEVASQGWHKGTIADLEQVTRSVKEAVGQAEAAAHLPLESAVVGVGGPQIQGASVSNGLTFPSGPRELNRHDVRRAMETALDIPMTKDREVLHVIQEEFVLDSRRGILDPIGMQGSTLAVRAHVITGSVAANQNAVTAVNRAGVLVETTVFEAYAAAEEVLTDQEQELGALVADLGAGSCELVAYRRRGLRMAAVVPIGGDHFTNDVALGLHIAPRDAEIIKKTFGFVLTGESNEGTSIEVPGLGDRPSWFVPQRTLTQILGLRAEELLGLVLDHILRCGLDQQLGAGLVLCGGGARVGGMCDLAEQVLGLPARLGLPPKIAEMPEALDAPEYATLLGLLLYAHRLWRQRSAAPNRSLGSRWWSLMAGRRRFDRRSEAHRG